MCTGKFKIVASIVRSCSGWFLFCLYKPDSIRLDTRMLNNTSLLHPERKQNTSRREENRSAGHRAFPKRL